MSPIPDSNFLSHIFTKRSDDSAKPTNPNALVLEAWAEGYMIGSLIILSCITLANMRRGVLLHKLILLELVLGYWQGVYILFNPPIYAWWLSVAAIPLNISWSLHNVIAWMKLRPFLTKWPSRIFIGTVILAQPYWVVEIYANFTYFHNVNHVFLKTRPWEALCRDPWWIVAACYLMYNIKTKYELSISQIVRISPRFAVMLGAMLLSIIFIVLDVLSVTSVLKSVLPVGINPFWKLSFVFKCLTDSVVLDDFKTALDRLRAFKISRLGSFAVDGEDDRTRRHRENVVNANSWSEPPPAMMGDKALPVTDLPRMPDQDDDYIQEQSRWEEIKSGPGARENEKYVTVGRRNPSRDRDLEENEIEIYDHQPPAREASDAPILKRQESWPLRHSTDSSDPGVEYAAAIRQVTNEDSSRSSPLVTHVGGGFKK